MEELIGRDREVREVVERLADRRLVTITGPGGIGKTSLARAVATRSEHTFPTGTHAIDLTRVDSPDAVAGAIAGQLGYSSFEALLDSPSDEPALLVVDNCEHVTASAADSIAALLEACAAPTVLATSRSPLGLPGESLVVLGPLPVPAVGDLDGDIAAARLFRERARDAGTSIGDDQLGVIGELCRQLDGVPLAIELAAARTRTMRPAEILERLGDGMSVLTRHRYRGDRRHRSLSATIDWSYHALDDAAAALFERLGVVPGPFTAALAEAMATDVGLDADAADAALTTLVDASLVVVEADGDRTLHRLLETVRWFALTRLEEHGTHDDAYDDFVDHIVSEVGTITADAVHRWDANLVARLLALYDSITAALRWCLAHDDDGGRALQLSAVLWGVVHQGHAEEIAALSGDTIRRWPDQLAPFFVDATATAATATYLTGDAVGAVELAEQALPASETSLFAPFTLHRLLGYATRALGDTDRAHEMFAEAASAARSNGLAAMAMEADVARAQLLADAGALDEALAIADDVRAEAAAAGSHFNDVWARTVAGGIELQMGAGTATATIEAALAQARRINYPSAISANLRMVALVHIADARFGDAARELTELFDSLIARGALSDLRAALHTTAILLHRAGRESWADLAATSRSLSIVSMMAGVDAAMFPLPAGEGSVLTRRDAITLARRELRALHDEADTAAAAGASSESIHEADLPDHPAHQQPRGTASLLDRGDWWEVTFAGRTVHIKASKGVVDLSRLLAAPDRDHHCLELMGADVEQSSTGEVLDSVARRQYEERVRELQADIDAAEADNDIARAERARVELDTLVDHLTAALGIGGRSRRTGGSAERARSAVTQRLRSTIRRLNTAHPELGRHLSASVVTGTYCSYRPEHPVSWRT